VEPNLAQQIPQVLPNHTGLSLGFARGTVKQWLRKAKLQPFNKTLSDMAALIKENSSPTAQHINSWRLWASKHGSPALATVAVRLLCMHPELVQVRKGRHWLKTLHSVYIYIFLDITCKNSALLIRSFQAPQVMGWPDLVL